MSVAVATKPSSSVAAPAKLTDSQFQLVAGLLHRQTGIHLPETKANFVYSRLSKRLRSLDMSSFDDYCALVNSTTGTGELSQMCTALTTNVTRFFREPHHFDHLKQKVLPQLLDAARAGERVRIWSSACSSGEEPYSIALTILSMMPDALNYDIKILATDINPNVVAKGREGIYPAADVESDIESSLRDKWFRKEGTSMRASDELRSLIAFKELNLIGDWPMKGPFQFIFCRNVVIYFDEPTTQMLWSRFAQLLCNNGHLYIGHSERVSGDATSYLHGDGVTTYQYRGNL